MLMDILRFFARNRVIITQLKTKKKKMEKYFFRFFALPLLRVFIYDMQCQLCHNANFVKLYKALSY